MKILFFDVDGVLITPASALNKPEMSVEQFDFDAIFQLKRIAFSDNAVLVCSSAWRKLANSRMLLRRAVPFWKGERTDGSFDGKRGGEIAAYLKECDNVESWAVIDDEICDMTNLPQDRIVKIDRNVGLSQEDADRVIKILGPWK